jgi:hypothetical protein
MSEKKTKLILANGESYIVKLVKKINGRPPKFPYEYEEARTNAIEWVSKIEKQLESFDKNKIIEDNFIFGLTLNETFFAKSYFPENIIKDSKVEFIGSRVIEDNGNKQKFIYARGDRSSINALKANLNKSEALLTKAWVEDIRKLEGISFIDQKLAFEGFAPSWKEGRVELVLHPMGAFSSTAEEALKKLLKKAGVNLNKLQFSNYGNNELKFASVYLTRDQLKELRGFNPLRTAHPMGGYRIPTPRSAGEKNSIYPESSGISEKSLVKVGMFDGGVDDKHPLLKNHVKENILTKASVEEVDKYVYHGNSVAGAMLYGDLAQHKKLPSPKVFVESFRVLPLKNEKDLDLHEVINHIEEVVASREDIKVYNISFGPEGPIYKDNITRFTYALDRLAHEYKVLFVVAVGNDGNEESPFNRIQAPSDIINGLGVGAFSFRRKNKEMVRTRAPYSCIGPGREGAQTKPDLVAFGGCDQTPMHLVGHDHNYKYLHSGTSFATPLVSALASELVGRCNQIKPLTARVLLNHKSFHPEAKPCAELGNGFAPESVEEIIECTEKSYTVLFQSSLMPGKYVKLPIPLPDVSKINGKVDIKWTVGILTRPDLKNSEEYSNVSIEDTFYPHSDRFKFYKTVVKKGQKNQIKSAVANVVIEKAKVATLINDGYKQSSLPDTATTISLYLTESERKAQLKWDATFTKSTVKMAKSLKEPFLSVHSLERNMMTPSDDLVHYAVSVTVKIEKFNGDIYTEIQKLYSKLNPVEVRSRNEVLIKVK